MLEEAVENPPESPAPLVTMGKREDIYDEPPPKKTYYRNVASGKKDPICGICLSGPERNKKGKDSENVFTEMPLACLNEWLSKFTITTFKLKDH